MSYQYGQHLPASTLEGLVPTKNNKGYMSVNLDPYSEQFISDSRAGQVVCELGAAYGNTVLKALEKGLTVVANDIEEAHVEVIKLRANHNPKLKCVVGAMPELDLEKRSFDAILCCRMLHFLKGEQVELSIKKIFSWLKPGGKFYLVIDTPYFGAWWPVLKNEFEYRKAQRDPWPSLMDPFSKYLSLDADRSVAPEFLNPFDLDKAIEVSESAGFRVLQSSYIDRTDFPEPLRVDGRESAGIILEKPRFTQGALV